MRSPNLITALAASVWAIIAGYVFAVLFLGAPAGTWR